MLKVALCEIWHTLHFYRKGGKHILTQGQLYLNPGFVFWILSRIFLSSTALELYVRQNLVKGLGLRLQWYHLPLAEIWYSWNLVFLDEIDLVNETHFLFTQGNEIWEKMPLEGREYTYYVATYTYASLWFQLSLNTEVVHSKYSIYFHKWTQNQFVVSKSCSWVNYPHM